jgi:hypothetical protein
MHACSCVTWERNVNNNLQFGLSTTHINTLQFYIYQQTNLSLTISSTKYVEANTLLARDVDGVGLVGQQYMHTA